ncbi:MAG: hypothetical protein Q8O94_04090 [bacterium]|nr:hypothetical protein [bacterium]
MEGNLFLSIILLFMPAVFILAMTFVSIFEAVGIRRLLCLYAAMFSGPFVGFCLGGAMRFLAGETAGVCSGILSGGAMGALAGLLMCSLSTRDEHTFGWPVFLIGAAVGCFTGIFAGALAGKQNYSALGNYFLFLFVVAAASFVVVQILRQVVRWLIKLVEKCRTMRLMYKWRKEQEI